MAWMTPVTTANMMIGEMLGRVMWRSRAQAPAPSSSAASYCSFGTSSSAAMKMTIRSPTPHSARAVSAGLDQSASVNQPGVGSPTASSRVLAGPVPGLSRKTKARVAATGGAR